MVQTPRLGLALLAAAQAQKHITHNEALTALDALVQACVQSTDMQTPPATPQEGDAYLVSATPSATGAFAGQGLALAFFCQRGMAFLRTTKRLAGLCAIKCLVHGLFEWRMAWS